MVRKAMLLPALFLIVVMPIVVWVLSGFGTHMSPLLLYPFASPWWVFFPQQSTAAMDDINQMGRIRLVENAPLLAGCAINAVLLGGVGLLIDQWARRSSRQ
jgi:hypothetical protein